MGYLPAIAPGRLSAEFLRDTETAIDRELDRWRKAGPTVVTVAF